MKRKSVLWIVMAGLMGLWLTDAMIARAQTQKPVNTPKFKEFRIERSMPKQAVVHRMP